MPIGPDTVHRRRIGDLLAYQGCLHIDWGGGIGVPTWYSPANIVRPSQVAMKLAQYSPAKYARRATGCSDW